MISKYLIQVTVPKEKTKQVRVSGARVLTSDECMKIEQEREDAKKKRPFNYKKERKREPGSKKKKARDIQTRKIKGTPLSTS